MSYGPGSDTTLLGIESAFMLLMTLFMEVFGLKRLPSKSFPFTILVAALIIALAEGLKEF